MKHKPYVVYINKGSHLTGEWKIDRRYKTMQEAAERADLMRELYDVRIINEGVMEWQQRSIRT
jgi:hypothetical protein